MTLQILQRGIKNPDNGEIGPKFIEVRYQVVKTKIAEWATGKSEKRE